MSGCVKARNNYTVLSGWRRYCVTGPGAALIPGSVGQVSQHGKGAKMPHIVWDEGGPRTCLLVKKPNSGVASRVLKEIALW